MPLSTACCARRRAQTMYLVALLGAAVASTFGAPAHAQSSNTRPGRIEGVVYDSVAKKPLTGATVQLLRTGGQADMRSATADSEGRFRFDSVAAGEWTVGAWHPRLDSLGVVQLARGTTVDAGKRRLLNLAIPSPTSIIRRLCGDSAARDSVGVVFGTIRRANRDRAGVQGSVRFKWYELEYRNKQFSQQQIIFDQTTAESGEYVACGVPSDARFQAQASANVDSSGVIEVSSSAGGIHRLDLFVGTVTRRPDTTIVTEQDSTGTVVDTVVTPYLVGPGRLDGTAKRDGIPMPGALVTLWGTGREVRSDERGRFTLAAMPLGSHTLELRAIGYEPLRRLVDLHPDEVTATALNLARVTSLDTVRIRAWALRNQGAFKEDEFLRRRRRGSGVFLSPEEMARFNPITMTQLLSLAGWVRTSWDIAAGETVTMGRGIMKCTPLIMVDGQAVDEETFFMMVKPPHILAIEIYRRSGTPAEFSGPSPCGSIIIWTGERPPVQR